MFNPLISGYTSRSAGYLNSSKNSRDGHNRQGCRVQWYKYYIKHWSYSSNSLVPTSYINIKCSRLTICTSSDFFKEQQAQCQGTLLAKMTMPDSQSLLSKNCISKTDYLKFWLLYKSNLRISTAGKRIEVIRIKPRKTTISATLLIRQRVQG